MRSAGSRAVTSLAVVGVVFLFTLAAQLRSVWLQAAGCGLVGLLAVSRLAVAFGPGCRVTMEHSGHLVVGVPAQLRFVVENPFWRRSRAVVIRYELASNRPLLPPVTVYVDSLAGGARVQVQVAVTPVGRGEATSGRWSIERIGPFGFFSAIHTRTTGKHVVVAPAQVAPLALPWDGGSSIGVGSTRTGLDVQGAREWRPGDGVRHVHWRSTARTGRLTVLERGEPSGATLGVVVAGTSGNARFEAMLAVAAATVGRAVDEGIECCAWIEQPGDGCAGKLAGRLDPESYQPAFARIESPPPPDAAALAHLVGHIGCGATLLVVADGVSPAWRDDLAAIAAACELTVVDLAGAI